MADTQQEPTMEEILASIRKIISEDTPETAAPEPHAGAFHEDVLELTHEAEVPLAPVVPAPLPEQEAQPASPPPVEETVFQAEAVAQPEAHSDIFSDHTRKAVEDAFDGIPAAAAPEPQQPAPQAPVPPPVDGASVESVFERAVRNSFEPVLQKYLTDNSGALIDAMKPLIREWMDDHFPALLEGAVRAEVERVVKARGIKR